jgi:fatty-acyl-CoA synthase
VMRQHPAIADVSVYAVNSEFFGEEVAAAIRPQPGAAIDAAEVQEFCKARLARFKVPRFIKLVDAFPMTASGKIQKYRLREQHEAELRAAPAPTASQSSSA